MRSSLPSTCDLGGSSADAELAVPRAVLDDTTFGPLPVLPLRRGDRVGRYEILSRLGVGGMGVVFCARDPELGRRVALKLVRQRAGEPPDPRHTARLRREARALARLSHDNVVELYDLGSTPRGIFLAMQFVEGRSLSEWLNHRPRTTAQILDAYAQAGRGLAAAHRAGIVHRDFKPTNAIIDERGHVTVVDFGLARGMARTGELAADSSVSWTRLTERLTQRNVILGTKGYMAPEQLLALGVTPAVDQFSLCVSLFEALFGMRPYPGSNAVETARAFAAGDLITPPPRPGVSRHVLRALQRGLAVEPDQRFEDMDALVAALSPNRRRRQRRRLVAAFVATAWASAGVTLWATRDAPAEALGAECSEDLAAAPRVSESRP
jgi:serine/threonine protein kinase